MVAGTRKSTGTRELLVNLTMREVRSQFKRTALGRLWSFINPLATIAIYSMVFGYILQSPIEPGINSGIHLFALFLAAALIPWTFLSGAIMTGMGSIVNNAGPAVQGLLPAVHPAGLDDPGDGGHLRHRDEPADRHHGDRRRPQGVAVHSRPGR